MDTVRKSQYLPVQTIINRNIIARINKNLLGYNRVEPTKLFDEAFQKPIGG